ncbi:terminase small subunit [Staphylococcus hyicus]|uniref:terminase small subunit n=1 Tax=Staphylococcus hyicus TaxID=1284 RepID=UPI0031333600
MWKESSNFLRCYRGLYRISQGKILRLLDKMVDESILTAKELLHLLTNAAVGDETETKEVVVKRCSFEKNPDTGRMTLVYNEHVELVEVSIKPSDRLKARDMLGKYHMFIDKLDVSLVVPVFLMTFRSLSRNFGASEPKIFESFAILYKYKEYFYNIYLNLLSNNLEETLFFR